MGRPRRAASLLFLLALRPQAAPADLLWPTDAGDCVTSSFCEFRPGHFHSGMDISTGGKIGFRCLAAGDGEIARARVSCGGYGRALYLRLEDGRTVVYAHLSRFAGAIADTMIARQNAAGTAYVDLEFPAGTFPVRRGGLVGWTGQSGTGVPHLHVEVRDRWERPLDPFREGWAVADTVPPVVTRLALTPLTPPSSVDGGSETVLVAVEPPSGPLGEGSVPRVVPVEGEIGLSVEVDETAGACRRRLAPSRIELREGGRLLHAVEYGAFAFSQTGLIDLQIDHRFSYPESGSFHHLWRRAGNTLPFSRQAEPGSGVLSAGALPLPERKRDPERAWLFPVQASVQQAGEVQRSFEIVVEDAAGNRGRARVALSFAAPPEVTVLQARFRVEEADASLEREWTDLVLAEGHVRVPGRPLAEVRLDCSLDGGDTWTEAARAEGERFAVTFPLPQRIPGAGRTAVLVRARALDQAGVGGLAKTVVAGGTPPYGAVGRLAPEVVTRGPWYEVRIPESASWSALSGGVDGDRAVLVRSWGAGVRIVCRRSGEEGAEALWSGEGPEWKGFDPWGRPVPLRFTAAEFVPDSGVVREERGLAEFRFPAHSLPEPVHALAHEEAAPTSEDELRPVAPLYVLDTGQVPLVGDYEVTLRAAPGLSFDEERLGIFVRGVSGLRYIDTARTDQGWKARARSLTGIGLFEDVTPPSLGEPRLEQRHGRVRLTFRAEDAGAGVGCDDVEVNLDGQEILHELDDETGDVVAFPGTPPPAEGRSLTYEVRVRDRVGNESIRSGSVRLP